MTTTTRVTMIGMGPMARAMCGLLLDADHPLTVWNRTPGRAAPLVARGAVLAADPGEALAASPLVLVSLTDYAAMDDVLGPHAGLFEGRTVVNLSSDTPERTRRAADRVHAHGGRFVAGGIMVPAAVLGTPQAYAFYSGDPDALEQSRPVLERVGRVEAVGEDPGLAQLYYQACLDVFLTSLAATLHATALLAAAGVEAPAFVEHAATVLELAAAVVPPAGTAIATGEHHDAGATAVMMGATADHVVDTSRALGVDAAIPEAVQGLYDRAIAAGRGAESWTTLYGSLSARS